MANFYISDTHFGHANIMRHCNREFFNVDEMDEVFIKNWNSVVTDNDDVYILGDFCYRNDKSAEWYLRKLKGRKHLVIGNHDGELLKNPQAMAQFETVDKMQHITDGDKHICLCHFPIAEWNGFHKGHWHIYGHIHGRLDDTYYFMRNRERALNAAACINNYTPVSLNELIRNNQNFKEMHK